MSTLFLVRHAEPSDDARGRCYGTLDVGLSALGRDQACALAESLSRIRLDAVVSSPRVRALATAEPIAAAHGLEVNVDERVRELDFGDFEGRTYEEIERSEPSVFRSWMESPTTVRFPNGESYDDLSVRAVEALEEIRGRCGAAVVVTHGGVIRAGLAHWLELPAHAIFRLDQRHTGVTVVEWLGEEPIVRLLNGEISG